MGSSLYFFMLLLVSVTPYLNITVYSLSPPMQPILCRAHDSSALLQFKGSFVIDKLASSDPLAYPKVESWTLQDDCCSWDGVICEEHDGHVIGLDLSSSCLFGSINSTSSLFRLKHLRVLSLADNNFNNSRIPPELARLSSTLTHLNLSMSGFSGQIPSEISRLSKLTVLDLTTRSLLQLSCVCFESFVQNVTNLEQLWLTSVDISSKVPNKLANLTSLTHLSLSNCDLQGQFPSRIFLLKNLQFLSIQYNHQLNGDLPEFSSNNSHPLESLLLRDTSFSGQLPDSIQNLHSLNVFDIRNSNFSGPIPSSFGNLTKLTILYLSNNSLSFVGDLSWLGQLTSLHGLALEGINISSEVPSSLASLTELGSLYLRSCQLTGHIPFWLMNMTHLIKLDFGINFMQGPIPESVFSQLVNLEWLVLDSNNFSGTLEFGLFAEMKNLTGLVLGDNRLSILDKGTLLPNLYMLDLASCNLNKFPSFLKHQQKLNWLALGKNSIQGLIPSWLYNTSKETLQLLDVSNNFLTGFEQEQEQPGAALSWANLQVLDLSHNLLKGPLPIPPPSITYYNVKNNTLTGEIPSLFCHLNSVLILQLSDNNLSSKLPHCLANLSSLSVLSLSDNNFHGAIPQMCTKGGSRLELIDLSGNQLEGKMPRSLGNCAMLRSLDLRENRVSDTFPFWMGKLEGLRILVLSSNKFHGAISDSFGSGFPSLSVLDLSRNEFSGHLTSALFENWKAIVTPDPMIPFDYLQTNQTFNLPKVQTIFYESFSMILASKGTEREYSKILNVFAAIDFSSNSFSGEIPESVGDLKGLYVLDLSNNKFTGHIPSSLANLSVLESLDLSRNSLSGHVPPELAQLNFLAFLNVSNNKLTGHVPRGKQMDTFQDDSFDGNVGLCGDLLITKRCRVSVAAPSPEAICLQNCEDMDEMFPSKSDWIVMVMGYAGGLVVGVVFGNSMIRRKPEWFVKVFGTKILGTQKKGQ